MSDEIKTTEGTPEVTAPVTEVPASTVATGNVAVAEERAQAPARGGRGQGGNSKFAGKGGRRDSRPRTPREKPPTRDEIRRIKYPAFPDLVAQGMTRKEIAAALHVGEDAIFKLKRAFGTKGHSAAFPRQGRAQRPITEVHPGIDDALRRGGSYRAIGAEFGLCRERVRQIEVRAFEKLQKAMLRIAGEKRLLLTV